MFRYLTLLLVCQTLINNISGQTYPIDVNVRILPPYPIEIERYLEFEEDIIVSITNTSPSVAYDLAFISNLEASNGIAVRSQEAKAPPGGLHIEPGETLTFMGEELQDIGIELREEDLELNAAAEGVRERVIRDRVLPEGDYEMCVQAVDFFDHTRDLSRRAPNGCEEFSILHFSPDFRILTPKSIEGKIEQFSKHFLFI